MKKLYVIARRDLPWAVRCVQAIHAATNLAYHAGDEWGPIGPHLVLLGVEDRHALAPFAGAEGAFAFYEPDMADQMTAVAIYAEALDVGGATLL